MPKDSSADSKSETLAFLDNMEFTLSMCLLGLALVRLGYRCAVDEAVKSADDGMSLAEWVRDREQ